MQEKQLFEYAVIRVMPRVEREEFFNVGVILFCSSQKFLETRYKIDENRLGAFYDKVDIRELDERLHAFEQICAGALQGGPIGKLPLASRFRWLTASRSTIVQTSAVHPGLCVDPKEHIEALFRQMVL